MSAWCNTGRANSFSFLCQLWLWLPSGLSLGCVEKECEAKSGFNKKEYYRQLNVSLVEVEERGAQGICHLYELKNSLSRMRSRRFGISYFQSMCFYFCTCKVGELI